MILNDVIAGLPLAQASQARHETRGNAGHRSLLAGVVDARQSEVDGADAEVDSIPRELKYGASARTRVDSDPNGWTIYELATTVPVVGVSSIVFSGVNLLDARHSNFVVPDIAELRQYRGPSTTATVVARTTFGDGGGGPFAVKIGDNATADDGALVIVDVLGRRCWRRFTGALYSEWFGVKSDGATLDTDTLTAFFNAVKASKSRHGILPPGTALIDEALPAIDVSNVCIEGAGAAVGANHDTGPFTGTVLKYTGSALGVPVIAIAPVIGASNQRLSGVKFIGVSLDCNGLTEYGISFLSVYGGELETTVFNPTVVGLDMGVVTTLGESKDCSRNRIRYEARCIEAPDGIGLRLRGDSVANVCFNNFEFVNIVHYNGVAARIENADNNKWQSVRCLVLGGGAATRSFQWLGGASEPLRARCECIEMFSANRAPEADEVGGGITHKPTEIKIRSLDVGNATPRPIGSGVYWENDNSPLYPSEWVAWTPTITSVGGNYSALGTVEMRYQRIGRTVTCHGIVQVNTLGGSASGATKISLPIGAAYRGVTGCGRETQAVGKGLQVYSPDGSADAFVANYDDTAAVAADGRTLTIRFSYELAP